MKSEMLAALGGEEAFLSKTSPGMEFPPLSFRLTLKGYHNYLYISGASKGANKGFIIEAYILKSASFLLADESRQRN